MASPSLQLTRAATIMITMLSSGRFIYVSSAFLQSSLAPAAPRRCHLRRQMNDLVLHHHHSAVLHSTTCRHYLPTMLMTSLSNSGDNESDFVYTTLDPLDDAADDCTTVTSSSRNLQHVLNTIEHAAYTASKIALATSGQIAVQSTKANLRDLVTESDVRCQQIIKEIIMKEFPNDLFLGEEDVDLSAAEEDGGSSGASRAALEKVLRREDSSTNQEEEEDRLVFIVDPIDGTTNFQAGLPIYAMSIGVVALSSSEVVAGVIYNPALGEMTSAVRGRGCYLNNRRIRPPSQQQQEAHLPPRTSILNQSLINVGFPISKESTLAASSKAVTALATKVRGLRMVACASQAMAWVAQSKFSAYFSWDLNGWDVAAGIVIVEESGGLVSKMRVVEDEEDDESSSGSSRAGVETRDMIITCPCERKGEEGLLRDELLQVLVENDCLEY